ncbi:sigma 54-interacting transcriptional regulator [Methylomonas sp. SURF-2]|uniref:Sigma 54-interacting transcriptional regulator n=1 Tax=Methylomonas subterranea TaxID=2952225 RepID=A0ABT1TG42_9GAMM|nr:sigma 54-interacting transcriptional regulator [Methylomonas sp. SURF-2]MCQ8104436.1 sigma 54-interacting transcriptional regulator [Methylomonas sp. SURF-2]
MATQPVDLNELSILQAVVEGTVLATGDDFLRSLVRNLCLATGVANGFIAEFTEAKTRVRSLAFWADGEFLPQQEWELSGTPCEDVLRGNLCHYPSELSKKFPHEEGVESYLGVPLQDSEGQILGHLALFGQQPMPEQPRLLYTFKIFAARAAAELNRLRMETQLRLSEKRYRELFDEAPIAYVHEDRDSRFLQANQAALRILGISPEQVPGIRGISLVPDTPDAQARLRAAFACVEKGTDSAGVVLELRRKDNGRPVWIQWWSKTDPSGQFMRTLFIDITERVLMEQAQARLQAQNLYLQEEIKSAHNFDEIVGRSPALRSLLNQVQRVAQTDASVLIQGESGTGKELIARAIHSASKRKNQPLIKVNCAALPSNLIESELFGHEKGAFTGAVNKRIGRFELAEGGTLFLDEIGEIPLDMQVKLLRVIQEREFERVGGQTSIKMNVRVITATNRNLLHEVEAKNFREDLFYRLNVFPLTTPPLRERLEDIPLLVDFLLGKFAPKIGKKITSVSLGSMRRLQQYRWPGNIRELENVIERAVILADGAVLEIGADQLPGSSDARHPDSPQTNDASLDTITREHILSVLEQTRWVIEGSKGAARRLNLKPSTLRYRMQKLGIAKTGQ